MPTTFKCVCGQLLQLRDEVASRPFRCPACGKVASLSVPTPQARPATPPSGLAPPAATAPHAPSGEQPVTMPAGSRKLWLLIDGRPHGPFTHEQVRERLSSGVVNLETQAAEEGGAVWQPLGRFPEFRQPAARSPLPAPSAVPPAVAAPATAPALPAACPQPGTGLAASLLGAIAGGQEAGDEEDEGGQAQVPSFDSRGDLKQDLADVRNVLWWVAGLLTAPALPTLITGLTSRPQAGMEEAGKLWQIFWFTFPLCLGIAIDSGVLFHAIKHNQMPKENDRNGRMLFWGILVGVLGISALIGNALGLGMGPVSVPDPTDKSLGGHPFVRVLAFAGKLLWNYFALYGPQMFFSSLVVGVFMGWAGAIKLLPHLFPAPGANGRSDDATGVQPSSPASPQERPAQEPKGEVPVTAGAAGDGSPGAADQGSLSPSTRRHLLYAAVGGGIGLLGFFALLALGATTTGGLFGAALGCIVAGAFGGVAVASCQEQQ